MIPQSMMVKGLVSGEDIEPIGIAAGVMQGEK
jgi:hypothetical protein